jgi:hypothetical protein
MPALLKAVLSLTDRSANFNFPEIDIRQSRSVRRSRSMADPVKTFP